MSDLEIFVTDDGSQTLSSTTFKQYYHSYFGALTESEYVFFKMGWDEIPISQLNINVLEIGFGTGLNTFIALNRSILEKRNCRYVALEPFPLEAEIFNQLTFAERMNKPENHPLFLALHQAECEVELPILPNFHFFKTQSKLEEYQLPLHHFDLIFFDAFAPVSQPELWTLDIFKKLYASLKPNGILTTYCAKGEVRRNMLAAGFKVEKLPGPPGKREMLRARKI